MIETLSWLILGVFLESTEVKKVHLRSATEDVMSHARLGK